MEMADSFDLFDILQIQGKPMPIDEPTNYLPSTHPDIECEAWQNISPEGNKNVELWLPDDRHIHIRYEDVKKINHIRHDYVANLLRGETDVKLSTLGINADLTPDCIIPEERKVLELSTCIASSEELVTSSYRKKRLAYEEVLQRYLVDYFILIVAPDRVLTNLVLSQTVVDELIWRVRVGLSLEFQVEKATGRRVMGDQGDREPYQKVRDVLQEIDKLPRHEYRNFNKSLTEEMMRENTLWEDEQVRTILSSKFSECLKPKVGASLNSIKEYKKGLRELGTKSNTKRVHNFPCLIQVPGHEEFAQDLPKAPETYEHLWEEAIKHLKTESWRQSDIKVDEPSYIQSLSRNQATNPHSVTSQHVLRSRDTFLPNLSEKDLDFLALSGVGAKGRAEDPMVEEHEEESHIAFDPDTDVSDIDFLIHNGNLEGYDSEINNHEAIKELLEKTKTRMNKSLLSPGVMRHISRNKVVNTATLITDICTELSYEYKVPHRAKKFGVKKLRGRNFWIMYKSTGSHIFCSFLASADSFMSYDTGRIGPQLYQYKDFIMSDFCSYNEHSLNGFVKAGPYMCMISSYLLQHFKLPILTRDLELPKKYWSTLKTILLLYLNNKLDAEEIVTNQRFMYMRILQEFDPDPYKVIDRLPTILRSRLSCYLLNRTIGNMEYYRRHRVGKRTIRQKGDVKEMVYTNLRGIFHNDPMSIEELVDSFYFGYVVSKAKGKSGDRNPKIVSKILKEELWAQEHINDADVLLWSLKEKPLKHTWSPQVLRYFLNIVSDEWRRSFGPSYRDQIGESILDSFKKVKFSDISTLKASSKDYSDPEIIFPEDESVDGSTYVQQLRNLNPKLEGKRPRVITSLVRLIKEYMSKRNDDRPTPLKVMLFSLQSINARGWFFSDCFPKDQHNGDREIHVLEIKARMFQFFFERLALALGRKFPYDSVCNPKVKETYLKEHESLADSKLGPHLTMCKSADATKWCQRHHSSKFYLFMCRLIPSEFEGFLYQCFSLWTKKRIAVPDSMLSILKRTPFNKIYDPMLKNLKIAFLKGERPFVQKNSNLISVEFGMFQGIPHRTSSVVHSVLQFGFKLLAEAILVKNEIAGLVTVIQGSDDSACLISFMDQSRKVQKFIVAILEWKELIGEYFSIWISASKTSIGTLNLVEYNSEWWSHGKIIKPTFRWVSACLDLNLVEVFTDRCQIFYSVLTQALESGGTTFLCSLIQLCQGWLHYTLLGLHNSLLKDEVAELILQTSNPALGFFPLDSDYTAGLTGFDFMIYRELEEGRLTDNTITEESMTSTVELEYEGAVNSQFKQSLKSTRLPFSSKRKWHAFRHQTNLGTLEDAIELVDENPEIIYHPGQDWKGAKVQMLLSIYNKGAVQSMSSYQPTIRMMAASAYIITRPCLRTWKLEENTKYTLLQLLINECDENSKMHISEDTRLLFPHQAQYKRFYQDIIMIENSASFQDVYLRRHTKSETVVWETLEGIAEAKIMDIVKRKWFQLPSVSVASRTFEVIWAKAIAKYPFLQNTESETASKLDMDHMSLYLFLSGLDQKDRIVRMQDSSARSSGKLDTISRVHWPHTKVISLVTSENKEIDCLRHYLYSLSTFFFNGKLRNLYAKDTLEKSEVLSSSLSKLPNKARKLKIMRDFLVDRNKEQAYMSICHIKSGAFGYFTIRQESMMMQDGKVQYRGPGEWLGEICNIPVAIRFQDGVVVKIGINKLSDVSNLSHGIHAVIQECKGVFPEHPDKSDFQLYLDSTGSFRISQQRVPQMSIPTYIDDTLESSNLEEVYNAEWDISIVAGRVRLIAKMGENEEFLTLLSDTLVYSDWDPTLIDFVETRDPLFNKWLTSQPATVTELEDCLELSYDYQNLTNYLRGRSQEYNFGVGKRYNKESFYSCLQGHYRWAKDDVRKGLEKTLQSKFNRGALDTAEQSGTTTVKLADLITKDVGRLLDIIGKTSDNAILKLSETPEFQMKHMNIENIEDIDLQAPDMEVIASIADMFMDMDSEDQKYKIDREMRIHMMPVSNNFFDSIDLLSNSSEQDGALYGILSTEFKDKDTSIQLRGVLGFLLSKLKGCNLLLSRDFQGESEIRELSEMATSHSGRHAFKISDIQIMKAEIEQLQKLHEAAEGRPKQQIGLTLQRKILEVQALEAASTGDARKLSMIPYEVFLDILLEQAHEMNLWDKSYLATGDKLGVIFIGDCLERVHMLRRVSMLSQTEVEAIGNIIWSKIVTEELVKAAAHCLQADITVMLDNENLITAEGSMSTVKMTLRFVL